MNGGYLISSYCCGAIRPNHDLDIIKPDYINYLSTGAGFVYFIIILLISEKTPFG